jgi:hypothetical protein
VSDPGGIQQNEIEGIVTEALAQLYAQNLQILRLDVAERTICAQLAGILQQWFTKHAVHTEYNRHGVEPKDIELPDTQGVLTRNRVNPDIIVHQPGHDDENILVIEVKKSTNAVADDADLAKLAQIKRQIAYRYALFLRLSTGPDADERGVRVVWV